MQNVYTIKNNDTVDNEKGIGFTSQTNAMKQMFDGFKVFLTQWLKNVWNKGIALDKRAY